MYKLSLLLLMVLVSCIYNSQSAEPSDSQRHEKSASSTRSFVNELVFDSALKPLFSLTDGFISLLFPDGANFKDIDSVVKSIYLDGLSADRAWPLTQQALGVYPGFSAAVVIGLLLFLLMPFIGCCCSCCRSCNKCGGKKMDFDPKNAKFKRCCWGGLLFIITISSLGGLVFLFFCASTIHTVTQKDFMVKKVDQIAFDFNSSIHQIFGDELTKRVTESVGGLEDAIYLELDNLEATLSSLVTRTKILEEHKKNITTAANDLNSTGFSDMGDAGKSVEHMESIADRLRDFAGQGSSQIETIQEYVNKMRKQNHIWSLVTSNYESFSKTFMNDVTNTRLYEYSKYWWYGLLGIGSLVGLIVLMFLMGILCGCGDRAGPDASCCNKGCAANFLLAGVGLSFISYSLLILITICLFGIGSLSTSHVCMTLQNPGKAANDLRGLYIDQLGILNISHALDGYSECLNNQTVGGAARALNLDETITYITDQFMSELRESQPINLTAITEGLIRINTSLTNAIASVVNTTSTIRMNINITSSAASHRLIEALELTRYYLEGYINIPNELAEQFDVILKQYNKFLDKMNSTFVINTAFNTSCFGIAKVVKDAVDTVCNTVIQPFNGFWFSLGWCLALIIPCITLSLVLSSYFRRKHSYEEKKETERTEGNPVDEPYELVQLSDPRHNVEVDQYERVQHIQPRYFHGATQIPLRPIRNTYQDHSVGMPQFAAVNRAYEK